MKIQKLNAHASAPVVRASTSEESAQRYTDEFMSAIRSLQVTSYEQKDSVLTVLIKWALTNSGEMSWSHHGPDSQLLEVTSPRVQVISALR